MANDKEMRPLSGDIVETSGVYQDNYGHEVQLQAGDEFPMDPQYGKVDYQMVGFLFDKDQNGGLKSDEAAAEFTNIPISAVNVEDEEAKKSHQLSHRRHGGDR